MGSLENPIFRVGGQGVVILVTKKTYRVELPKTGGLGQFAVLREGA